MPFTERPPAERPPETRRTALFSGSTRRSSGSGSTCWTAPKNWLAREIGVSPAYVSKLVNGRRSPSGRIRRRMLRALGVTDSDDLFRTEDKHERS